LTETELLKIHSLKTGAIIRAAALLGCIAAEASDDIKEHAAKFAQALGLAFQIKDDILDVTASPEVLGKTPGKDKGSGKTTLVDIYGVEKAQELVVLYTEKAIKELSFIPDSDFLVYLTKRLCNRVM
jgi:geranylgeranyl diphosphate synthase type II